MIYTMFSQIKHSHFWLSSLCFYDICHDKSVVPIVKLEITRCQRERIRMKSFKIYTVYWKSNFDFYDETGEFANKKKPLRLAASSKLDRTKSWKGLQLMTIFKLRVKSSSSLMESKNFDTKYVWKITCSRT